MRFDLASVNLPPLLPPPPTTPGCALLPSFSLAHAFIEPPLSSISLPLRAELAAAKSRLAPAAAEIPPLKSLIETTHGAIVTTHEEDGRNQVVVEGLRRIVSSGRDELRQLLLDLAMTRVTKNALQWPVLLWHRLACVSRLADRRRRRGRDLSAEVLRGCGGRPACHALRGRRRRRRKHAPRHTGGAGAEVRCSIFVRPRRRRGRSYGRPPFEPPVAGVPPSPCDQADCRDEDC